VIRHELLIWLHYCLISPTLPQRSHGQHERCRPGAVPLQTPVECSDISSPSSSVSSSELSSNRNSGFDHHSSERQAAPDAGGASAVFVKAQSHSRENFSCHTPCLVCPIEQHASCNGCCMQQRSVRFLCPIKSAGVSQMAQDSKGYKTCQLPQGHALTIPLGQIVTPGSRRWSTVVGLIS
jgi:hypothetical protein